MIYWQDSEAGPGSVSFKGPKLSYKRAALYLLLCFLGFYLAAMGIRALTPWPKEYGLRYKFDYFKKHKDEYDALIFGSSGVYRSFVPEVIENTLARHGIEMRFFNFGTPAMISFETDNLLKEVLALKPARLKWIFIEPSDFNPAILETHAFAGRMVRWHSTEETFLAMISSWLKDTELWERLELMWDHFVHWGWRMSNYGSGPDIFKVFLGWDEPDEDLSYLGSLHGYRPLEDEVKEEYKQRHETFLNNQKKYRHSVKKMMEEEDGTESLEGLNMIALRRQVSVIRAAGAEPIYIMGPVVRYIPGLDTLLESGEIPALMAYNSPSRYAHFYLEKNRFDKNHLTREAAVAFSRRFAKDLARFLAERGER